MIASKSQLISLTVGKKALNEGRTESVYDEPHFQQYDDHSTSIVLVKCAAYQKTKKKAFTDVDTFPSLEESGNINTSREYHVYDNNM